MQIQKRTNIKPSLIEKISNLMKRIYEIERELKFNKKKKHLDHQKIAIINSKAPF